LVPSSAFLFSPFPLGCTSLWAEGEVDAIVEWIGVMWSTRSLGEMEEESFRSSGLTGETPPSVS